MPVALLPDCLGAITSRKSAKLGDVLWLYDALDDVHDEMLASAIRTAQKRAAITCRELRHRNLGVSSLTEKLRDGGEPTASASWRGGLALAERGGLTSADLGLEVSHSKTVWLELRISFFVEPEDGDDRPVARSQEAESRQTI